VAAVLALAVIGGLVLWSRGGDDEARFDPVRADELAKSAMISTSDLPGQGWQQEDKDPDEGRASELFGEESDPACRSISERLDAVRRQNEADRAGEAVREFDLADPSPTSLDASMRVSVAIFRTGNGLDKALDEVRGALADRSMPACFEDIFGGSGNASGGPSVTAKPVTAHATAPRSGVAQAFELAVRLPAGPGQAAQTETARLEFYYWRYGNAGVSVFAFGGPALTKGAAQAAVTKTQTALEREAGED